MELEYARQYRNLYQNHWWWRSREEAIVAVIRKHFGETSGARILDVGCGDALFFDRLAPFGEVQGIEPDAGLVNPSGPHSTQIKIAPFDHHFRPPWRFSLVLMLDVLEHIDDPAAALRHAHSLLKPSGSLLVTVPAFQLLWTNHDVMNHHVIRYRRSTLRPLLRDAGFVIREERYWYQWTCPVKLAVRAYESIFRPTPAPTQVPPKPINRLLYHFSRAEQKILGSVPMPFGSTLMVFCTKDSR